MTTTALIVAAGRGTRAGGHKPKQWQMLASARVIDHTLAAFQNHPGIERIVVVLHPDDMVHAAAFEDQGITVAEGGADRATSVRHGLAALGDETHVLIHDAARPCVSAQVISGVLDALVTAPAAAPGLAITDALWRGAGGRITGTTDRAGLFAAQTPQGFEVAAIRAAHDTYAGTALDDVEVARAAGITVTMTPGDADNIKITTADDFARAARILENRMDIRTGNGFDVHA